MTKENAKKLFDHYMSLGRTDLANQFLKKHPEFAKKEVEEEVKEEKVVKNGKKSKR